LHANHSYISHDPNFLACDLIGIAETRLTNDQTLSSTFELTGFTTYSNSSTSCNAPPHGLATYIKQDLIPYDTLQFHSKYLEFTVHFMPESFSLRQIVFLYYAPNKSLASFQDVINENLAGRMDRRLPTLIIGDFNFNVNKHHPGFLQFLSQTFGCTLIPTGNTTDDSQIVCFSNVNDTEIHLIECPWSDHKAVLFYY